MHSVPQSLICQALKRIICIITCARCTTACTGIFICVPVVLIGRLSLLLLLLLLLFMLQFGGGTFS
jgi:hypothetical protein